MTPSRDKHGLLLIATYRPLGPTLIHVCQACFDARDPESPRTCLPCRTTTCAHIVCLCDPVAHIAVSHYVVPIVISDPDIDALLDALDDMILEGFLQ